MNGVPDNINDDVRAAFNSLAASEGTTAAPEPPVSDVIPPPKVESKTDGQRDEHGRFLPKNKDEIPPLTEPKAPVPPVTPPASTTPPDPNAPIKLDATKPPQGWTPELKAKWDKIPEDIRGEIIRREEDMAAGVQRLVQQNEPAREIYDAVAQHGEYFEQIEMDPVDYLTQMIESEQVLALGNPAQKFAKLLEIADGYGIPVRKALDQAMGGKLQSFLEESHKVHKTPPSLPPEVMQELKAQREWRSNLEATAAQNELTSFASDKEKHPFFDQVRDQMAEAIETGVCETYEDAYDYCVWKNPALRAKAAAQSNGASQLNGVQQRQVAAAAVVPPASSGLSTAADDGLGDDIYADVRRAIAAQSSGV